MRPSLKNDNHARNDRPNGAGTALGIACRARSFALRRKMIQPRMLITRAHPTESGMAIVAFRLESEQGLRANTWADAGGIIHWIVVLGSLGQGVLMKDVGK